MSFKGVNPNAIILTLDEPFITIENDEVKIGTKKNKYMTNKKMSRKDQKAIKDLWDKSEDNKDQEKQLEAFNYFGHNNENRINNNNEIRFFEQIYKTGEAYILAQSFRKIIKNSNRNVSDKEKERFKENNKIQVQTIVKHIKIDISEGQYEDDFNEGFPKVDPKYYK